MEMTPPPTDMQQLLSKISGMKKGGKFSPYIEFIQFPNYRNFEKNLRVSFKFPLTAIVRPI